MSWHSWRDFAWMYGLAMIVSACSFDFSPYRAVYACERDQDCAEGWVCVVANMGGICARPVDVPDAGDDDVSSNDLDGAVETAEDVANVDGVSPNHPYLVVSDVSYIEAGDGIIERVDGSKTLRFFLGPEPLTLAAAHRFCENLEVGGHLWRLASATQLGSVSQCCLTRPGRERCSGTANCYNTTSCTPVQGCFGCGAPPEGWPCWWHPTFDRPCGVFWAVVDGDCASAFDFRTSERRTLGDGAIANVLCASSSD
jgi:hypothetical protein